MASAAAIDLDLVAVRTFLVVVEAGGVTAAARRLGASKSVVSARIAGLEATIGVNLFNRGPRLTITDRGRAFYEGVKQLLGELGELVHTTRGQVVGLHGRARLSLPTGLGGRYLGQMICSFLAEHPDLEAQLDYSDDYVDIAGGDYDLAFRIGQPTDSDLVGRRLCRIRRLVCASPAYLERYGRPERPEDLATHRGIGYGLAQATGQWTFEGERAGRMALAKAPRLVFVANGGEAMRDAALAGLGVAILPSFFIADDVRAGRLCNLSLGRSALPAELWALHAKRREVRPVGEALVGWLSARLGDPPFWEAGI